MLLDFDVQRMTRRCAATGRALEAGEECFSVLEVQGADMVRKDYGREAWSGPPEGVLGWWRTRVPDASVKKIKLAPNEVLLELFDHLADEPQQADMRYVLALLLVRRRVFRLETATEKPAAEQGGGDREGECMFVFCPKREANYVVPAVFPGEMRIDEIQHQLSDLLVAGAA